MAANPTYWGMLKQPDKHKSSSIYLSGAFRRSLPVQQSNPQLNHYRVMLLVDS